MPFALMTAGVVMVISASVGSSVAWQLRIVSSQQAEQDAQWAALNAVNLGMQRLSTIDPATLAASNPTGVSTTIAPSTAPPAGLPFLEQVGSVGVSLRWWVQKSAVPENITLFAQGQGGMSNQLADDVIAVVLRYDYTLGAWVQVSMRDASTA